MKETSINKVLTEQKLSDTEKKTFLEILKYAKASIENSKDNLKPFINNHLNEAINHEI